MAALPGLALAQYGAYEMFHHWDFRPADANRDWGRVEVPGNLHLDLWQNGHIPHPFSGQWEDSLQWISARDWSYRSHLHVSDTLLASGHPELVFEGLDTYADIYLNGVWIKRTDNMFRTWRIPVEGRLHPGHNSVEVLFRSAEKINDQLQQRAGMNFPGGNRVFSRKAQYQFGWDWGPRFISAGVYKNAALITWNRARITDVHYRLDSLVSYENTRRVVRSVQGWGDLPPFEPDTAWLTVLVDIEADAEHELTLSLSGELPPLRQSIRTRRGHQQISLHIAIPQPKLWWSKGLGEAKLYRARMALEDPLSGLALDQDMSNIGLRIIELIREKDAEAMAAQATQSMPWAEDEQPPAEASSFYFRLNGVAVYARGANWIPTSPFVFGYVPDYLRLLRDVERSYINMLRVWGGGIYELDIFYDWCSRNGVLIWQDFMFACGMYPGLASGFPEFTENVSREVEEQIRRLRKYPALALWCGNNEVAEGWARWGWKEAHSPGEQAILEADYQYLFEELIPHKLAEFHPELPYWPSSPLYGRGDERHRYQGDAHDWWVWHDGHPFADLERNIPRFMSEFGFQAYPDLRTIARWREPNWVVAADRLAGMSSDTVVGSGLDADPVISPPEPSLAPPLFDPKDAFFDAHQKHPRGTQIIEKFLHDEFGADLPDSLALYIYLSQFLQADGMGRALEAQRRARPWCMGSLYWQFNDAWPAVSWSGIDVDGRWKAMQYRVRRAYEPLMVSSFTDAKGIWRSVAVNDRAESTGLLWELSLWSADGERLYQRSEYADLSPASSTELWSADETQIPELKRPDVMLHIQLREMGRVITEHSFFPGKAGDWPRRDPGLIWRLEPGHDDSWYVRVKAERPVRGLWLHSDLDLWMSDNGFDLLPGREKLIELERPSKGLPVLGQATDDPWSKEAIERSLKLWHLAGVLGAE